MFRGLQERLYRLYRKYFHLITLKKRKLSLNFENHEISRVHCTHIKIVLNQKKKTEEKNLQKNKKRKRQNCFDK